VPRTCRAAVRQPRGREYADARHVHTALPEAAHTRCSMKCSHMHICCIIFLLLGSDSFYINEMMI
jgi:hypothetical protein